jgi:predicted small secreted protein
MATVRITLGLALAAALASCNTVQGVGRDVQSGGQAIERGADSVRRALP